MQEQFNKIIENELLFKEMATKQFVADSSINRRNVKQHLANHSKEIRHIIHTTNNLIDQYVMPFLKEPGSISKEEALQFQDFASRLSGYRESIDTGLSYDIHHALTEYARLNNDDSIYIHNMFYKGLTLFYLDRLIFKPEMSECYSKVIAFADRYVHCDQASRNLIARAHGNYYISVRNSDIDEIYRRYDQAAYFWNYVGCKVDPHFPWNAYMQNLHENVCSTTITTLRSSQYSHTVKDWQKKRLLQSAQYLYDLNIKNEYLPNHDYTSLQIKHIYYLRAAKYYNGMMSSGKLLDTFYDLYKQAKNEYNYDDLYKKLHVSALYMHYLAADPPPEAEQKKLQKIAINMEEDVLKYVENIPLNIDNGHVTGMITNFTIGSKQYLNYHSYLKLLLSMTVFRHIPTYVHSVMVAKMSYTIVEYLIKYMPKTLIGLPGIDSEQDVVVKAEEILNFVWYCGLIHDIGKIVYSHLVSFYVRRLNDKEFHMIKQHSTKAEDFIKISPDAGFENMALEVAKNAKNMKLEDNPDLFACFSDIAFGHHKSYDGKFGYPNEFNNLESQVKTVIDIISITDSIDAATDSVGRSYAKEKFLSDMEDDLLSQIDTRYNPVIAKAIFENKELYDAIDTILNEYRYDIYYSCFSTDDFSKTMIPPNESTF